MNGGGTGPGGSYTGHDPWVPTDGNPLYIDPDNQEFCPKPANEKTLGISGDPDHELGNEFEI
jgi:hypothetical protein